MRIVLYFLILFIVTSCFPLRKVYPKISGVYVNRSPGYYSKIKLNSKGYYKYKGRLLYTGRRIRRFKVKEPFRLADSLNTSILLGFKGGNADTLYLLNDNEVRLNRYDYFHRAKFHERILPIFIRLNKFRGN